MLAVICHQFNYFLNSYDRMYKKDKLPIQFSFFLLQINKNTGGNKIFSNQDYFIYLKLALARKRVENNVIQLS